MQGKLKYLLKFAIFAGVCAFAIYIYNSTLVFKPDSSNELSHVNDSRHEYHQEQQQKRQKQQQKQQKQKQLEIQTRQALQRSRNPSEGAGPKSGSAPKEKHEDTSRKKQTAEALEHKFSVDPTSKHVVSPPKTQEEPTKALEHNSEMAPAEQRVETPPETQEEPTQLLMPESTAEDGEPKPIPSALIGLVKDMEELKGRHSDYLVEEPCTGTDNRTLPKIPTKYGFLGPFDYLENYKNPCWFSTDAGRLQCVPYVYIVGTFKAATSDLYERLLQHPDILPANQKEGRFFDLGRYDGVSLDDYVRTFRSSIRRIQEGITLINNDTEKYYHGKVLIDASPGYARGTQAWRALVGNEGCLEPRINSMGHIHHLWPKAKIIFTVRNPITRLLSNYIQTSRIHDIDVSAVHFDELVRETTDVYRRCLEKYSFIRCNNDYVARREFGFSKTSVIMGAYSRYLLDLLKVFPRDQIYILHYETYIAKTAETLKEIYKFLELPPLSDQKLKVISRLTKVNGGKYKFRTMWPSTWNYLQTFYAPFNAELSAILGGDKRYLWLS